MNRPIVNIYAAIESLNALIEAVEGLGGLAAGGIRQLHERAADKEWVGLAEAYKAACQAVGKDPVVRED